MANQERGEYTLVAGTARYTLRLTTNACCELEELSGRTFDQLMVGANKGSVKDLRFILWAALREHHADIAVEAKDGLKAVGAVMDACGGLVGILGQIRALIALNAESREDQTGGTAPAGPRPPSAQAGTGDSTPLTH